MTPGVEPCSGPGFLLWVMGMGRDGPEPLQGGGWGWHPHTSTRILSEPDRFWAADPRTVSGGFVSIGWEEISDLRRFGAYERR
jgi:hypothetical protein